VRTCNIVVYFARLALHRGEGGEPGDVAVGSSRGSILTPYATAIALGHPASTLLPEARWTQRYKKSWQWCGVAHALLSEPVHQVEEEWVFADRGKKFNFQLGELAPDIGYLGGHVLLQMVPGSHKQRQHPAVPCAVVEQLPGNLMKRGRRVLHEAEHNFVFADILFQIADQLLKRLEPVRVLAAVS
jgi:hypothetical protein